MRVLITAILCTASAMAADSGDLSPARVEEIIKAFTAKEAEFAVARSNYTYRQTLRIQDLDRSGREVGRMEEISDIVFDRDQKRTEHVTFAPLRTLKNFDLDPADIQDVRDIQPFVLTTETLPKYLVRYLGKEKLDELDCYAFAVKPKQVVKGERYFSGIVWVDDQDIQVVKTYGRAVGIAARGHMYPKFETYRKKIDGKYWFPVYTIAEDNLYFEEATARIREVIKYENYAEFKATSRIVGGAEEVPSPNAPLSPSTPPSKPTSPAPVTPTSPTGLPPPTLPPPTR